MITCRQPREACATIKACAFALAWLLLASGGAAPAQTDETHTIRWRDYTIDTRQPPQALPEALSIPAFPAGQPGYYFVQFTGPITREMKERAAQAGAELLSYVPDNAYLTRMSGEARRRVEELPIVRWVGIYQPAFRISEPLRSRVEAGETVKPPPSRKLEIEPPAAPAGPQRLQLTVLVFQGEAPERIGAEIESLGGTVATTAEDSRGSKLLVEIPPDRLDDLARIPGVKWIEPFELPTLRNDTARGAINIAPVWSAPPGLTGNGQIVAVADTGLDSGVDDATLHDDFEGRIVALNSSPVQPYPGYLNAGDDDGAADLDSGHGTHVAGSCAGDGTMSAGAFSGVAPDAGLVFQAIEQWTDRSGTANDTYRLSGIPFDLEPFFQQAYDAGARIHTNSWGGGDPGEYGAFSEDVDQFVWDHPDALILYAAGNDGEDADLDSVIDTGSVTPPGTCKNCLTVGASENDRPAIPLTYSSDYGPTIDQDLIANQTNGMAAFSSRGPTGAGRIKPDVVAPGTMVASTRTQAAPNRLHLSDDMEGGTAGWTSTGAWAQTTADAHSAATSWHDSPGGNYAAGAAGRLTSPTVNLSTPELVGKTLQFWARWDFPDPGDQWILEVSNDGGASWPASLTPFTGTQATWELINVNPGSFAEAASFRVRFRLAVDADATTGDGLYIDDVRIVEGAFGASLLSDQGLAAAGSPNDQSYLLMNGTSMATPLTAGAAALARQYYTDVAGLGYVSAALLRATLINGAVDATPGQYGMGATQEMAARPNNVEGWGRVDLGNSLFPAAPAQLDWVDELAGLETGESRTYTLNVTDTSVPIVVTLVYHDFPGEPLTNQLDLSLAPPAGPAVFPNGLAAPDTVNNVEQIFIPAAAVQAGGYTLTVDAPNVPQGPQPYALVVTSGGTLVDRDPVDVMLVLDLSGSMLSPACPGCQAKLDVLKDAVEIFVQLWTALAVPTDRLGITYFRTNVDEFDAGGTVLLPVIPNAAAMIGDVQAQTTTPFDLTAMGGGLQSALSRLTDAARPRNVILLTDGMQNVNPMVRRIDDSPPAGAFHLEIDDDPAVTTGSGVPPTVPPTELGPALDRKINTIAVGASDPWVALLQEIASETGGLHKATTAPDDELRRFYVEELVDALRNFSPQLVAYRTGQLAGGEAREEFQVNKSARKILLKLSWQRGAQMGFAVEKDGQDLTQLGQMIQGPFYQIYTLDLPASLSGTPVATEGEWVLKIRGFKDADYQAAAIVDEPVLDYGFSAGDGIHAAGQPLGLGVRLSVGGSPVTDARVSARVLKPGSGMGTLLSTTPTPSFTGLQAEPSATGGQMKLQLLLQDEGFWQALRPSPAGIDLQSNGDGSYSAAFAGTTVPGTYQVEFHVEGEHPGIGSYRRTETLSVLVEFAEADFDASEVQAIQPREGPVALLLRPRDRRGNYLGPDYAHRIRVHVTPGSAGQPEDLLDGRYRVPLSGATPGSAVEISVMDRPLFQGTLSSLGTYRYALSFHAGVTDPQGDFDTLFDDGVLVELDLERTLSERLSLIGVLGRYSFDPGFDVHGGTLYLRGYLPWAGLRLFGEVGAGLYDPENLDLAFGLSAGLGVDRSLTADWRGEIGAGYFHLFDEGDDLDFFAYKIGLRRTF